MKKERKQISIDKKGNKFESMLVANSPQDHEKVGGENGRKWKRENMPLIPKLYSKHILVKLINHI